MATTKDEILGCLNAAKEMDATHVIVVCDTYDWDDFPVYVCAGDDPREVASQYDGKNMNKLMEVYKVSLDWESQLSAHRSFNY